MSDLFIDRIKTRRIIIFGTSAEGTKACVILSENTLFVDYFVDNSCSNGVKLMKPDSNYVNHGGG